MSRVIKFRAWDGEIMHENVNINQGSGVVPGYQWFQADNTIGKGDPLMQFTGIDLQGIELWEGDIISDHIGIGEVKYSEKHGAFRVCYGDGMAKWFHDYNLKGERESIQIIGDIHRNPELLEAKS